MSDRFKRCRNILRMRGFNSLVAKRAGIHRQSVWRILSGRDRCSVEFAIYLEVVFAEWNLNITRHDLLWGMKQGESLADYFDRKYSAHPGACMPTKKAKRYILNGNIPPFHVWRKKK